ncbi:hypothetical protein AB0F88_17135 [Streptosporangium sp. NPDC023963]|uniref:hypothetical protein n=1 Tax=Streptosporangium sp. NPDC023963 TaxID=3155608 RepID=UPI00342D5C8C
MPPESRLAYHRRTPSELYVRACGAEGGVWEAKFTVGYGLGGPFVEVHVSLDAFAEAPALFAALGEHRPATLDEIVEVLGGMGAADETEERRRREEESHRAFAEHLAEIENFDDMV